jgi:asparaginyl-tRNA synthetase
MSGRKSTIKGWVYNRTDKGKLVFLLVRDGSGFVQCVAFKGDLTPELFDRIMRLPQESSVIITGAVREDKRAPGIPGGYELGVKQIEVVQEAARDYPMSLKDHGRDFALDNRHLWIRMQSQWAILRVRVRVMSAVREYLDSQRLLQPRYAHPDPRRRRRDDHPLRDRILRRRLAYLAQTGQLYNEANIFSFGKVYCFGPTFRAEKSKTRRHLTEFWMLEPEIAFCDLDGLMEVEEGLITHIVQTVLRDCAAELKFLERDVTKLENIAGPFPRMSYDDAAKYLIELYEKETDPERKELLKFEWGMDFGAPHEVELTKLHDKPCSSTATRARSRPSTWSPGPAAPKSANPWTCSRPKATARSAAAPSA